MTKKKNLFRLSGAGRCKSLCGLFLNKVCKCLQNLLGCLAFVTLKATKKKKLIHCSRVERLHEPDRAVGEPLKVLPRLNPICHFERIFLV